MSPAEDIIKLISEHGTRKKYIDPELKKRAWFKKYIKEEVNSVKSDFKNTNFVLFEGTVAEGDRFIDYVLLAEDNSPLAIIEAKKYSRDPKQGRIQARTYAKDIEKQVGYKIPIFLTNGRIWEYIDQHGGERRVSGPFTQEDLHRKRELFKNERDPSKIKINTKIVDRPKSILNVRRLSEHFAQGYRSALIEMATGTGKTRVAMALIDLLRNANLVRNVLFIVDRVSLADQASEEGFKKFFTEPPWELHRKGFSDTARFYATTVQTLMGKGKNGMFERFSPGFFDLIIFDEAHRSYYDKNNLIHQYFDAIKIGLTATPRKHESKNTYNLFDCINGKPTVEYSYDNAVIDKVLVPYTAQIIETKILSLGIEGSKLTADLKDQLRVQEENPETTQFTGAQYAKVFMDDKTNELIVREFMNRCYKSNEGLPCKSIFFCAGQKHAERVKKIFDKLFPKLGNHVQVIHSALHRAADELRRFRLNSEPRIALSVGMLDTGVDIPEVCNLVFVKPVFSHIRFWQMVGRGTRSLQACKHPEWLFDRDKKEFIIFDFMIGGHSNIIYHKFKKTKEKEAGRDVITQIFKNRVSLLKKALSNAQKKIIFNKIIEDISALGEESFILRDKLPTIKKIKKSFDLDKYIKELEGEIAPLMILNQGTNPTVSSFILQVEKLFRYILDDNSAKIDKITEYVQEMLENILQKESLSEIKAKKREILKVLQEEYWEDLTFEDVEFIIKELAPLIRHYEKQRKRWIEINAPDIILNEAEIKHEIKEDPKFKELIEKNPLIKKIEKGEGIISKELLDLEKQLCELNPSYTIENVQKSLKTDFLEFIHEIIGLTHEYDPKEIIEREFDKFMKDHNHYNSRQLEFLELLKKVFAERKKIELKDLAEEPLSNLDPLGIFQEEELKVIVEMCNKIKMK